jgi:hypothetical protein
MPQVFKEFQAIVDLVGLIAAYDMVSRLVAAFDIRPDNGKL